MNPNRIPRYSDSDEVHDEEDLARGMGRDAPARGHAATSPTSRATGNERIYEAYNDLHTLAQVFEKPFDAPAILVVGHQTDGKSGHGEALMGFQFLTMLGSYIEVENARLEDEQLFWGKEIVVRVEYRYCPNLTIIDTPGLISAAPGERNGTLQNYSKQVEAIAGSKMEQKEFTVPCPPSH
eukprot:gene24450-10050_t